jgi:Lysyl oxidase/Secretion system C-terminal sorting domain
MKTLLRLIPLLVFCCTSFSLQAQCGSGQVEVIVSITPDQYPGETTWQITDNGGSILAQGANAMGDTVCVPANACLTFTIFDAYGDGICCAFGNGSYALYYANNLVATGGQFATQESTNFGACPVGSSCSFPDTITTGSYAAPSSNYWYHFSPDSTGTYEITTCGNNTCNTIIWVYDQCAGLVYNMTNIGTVFYNDDDCGVQARVTGYFAGGDDYYIRIGGYNCPGAINWSLSYVGPVIGCTDPTACNYNPLATVSDTCLYPGDPNCPDGPDLWLLQSAIETSLMIDVIPQADPCYVNEGCVTGYGRRDIIRFTTHIKNIGNQDYFIGDPTANPQMFTFDNCHGHYHMDGYAEYILYDSVNNPLPIGFKNGFCVLDLECSGGGNATYSCGYMGISAGCGDIYDASLDCQWIDITTVAPGRYTLVAKTNWDQSPDALGRVETDFLNNWAQVCINITRDAQGVPSFTVDPVCPIVTDCNGTPYGNAVNDCAGVCDGTALHGDLNTNQSQEVTDGQLYVSGILGSSPAINDCNDLNDDGAISVTDAALINACAIRGSNFPQPGGGFRDYCDFPAGILNINDTVSLRIASIDYNAQTIDIEMLNRYDRVVGYQFSMSGVTLSGAANLVPTIEYPEMVQYNAAGTVIAVSGQDSTIERSNVWRPLTRLSYSATTGSQICIAQIVDVVNSDYEDVITRIENACVGAVDVPEPAGRYGVQVYPNPFTQSTTMEFTRPTGERFQLSLVDLTGKVVRDYGQINGNRVTIERGTLPAGLYFYRLEGKHSQQGKLMVR